MDNNNSVAWGWVIIIIIIVALGIVVWWHSRTPVGPTGETASTTAVDEMTVENVVKNFGSKLQAVSLLAPTSTVASEMQTNYALYVTPTLLQNWENSPQTAPGKLTSSPWPDHIRIDSIQENADGSYMVSGAVIEMTSVEVNNGGASGEYPVVLTLTKQDDNNFKISNFSAPQGIK